MTLSLIVIAPLGLDGAVLARVGNAVGMEQMVWHRLGADAATARLPDRADAIALRDAAAKAAGFGVDVAVLPLRVRRVLVCDLESTLVREEGLDAIALCLGKGAQVAAITARAMAGAMPFAESLRARLRVLAGAPHVLFEEVAQAMTLNAGAQTLIATMRGLGARVAIASSGCEIFVRTIAERLGIADTIANCMTFSAAGALVGLDDARAIVDGDAKAAYLRALCQEEGVDPQEAVALGDGANDIAMAEAAGLAVAYRGKPALARVADATLRFAGLEAALLLQGVPRAAFHSCGESSNTPT